MLRFLLSALLVALMGSLTGCEPARGTEDLPAMLPTPVVDANRVTPGQRLGAMDIITVNVFGAPDLSGDYQIDFEGYLKMPLIGEVSAAGRTASGLAGILELKLEESYLQNPEVTVLMKEAQERIITVDGSVEQPGQYPIEGKTTLMQAVAMSGGVDEFANLKRVVVFREIEGQTQVAGFNLVEIRDGKAPDPELLSNDIVIVDGTNVRRDYRDLVRAIPILYVFRPF